MQPKCLFSGLLPLLCAALFAEDPGFSNPSQGQIATGAGQLTVRKLGAIAPQNPIVLASDVFTPVQMEGAPVNLLWKEEKPGTFSVRLNAATAGADLADVEYVKTFSVNGDIPEIKVSMEFRNTSGKLRYAAWGVKNDFMLRPNAFEPIYLPSSIGTFPSGDGLFLNYYTPLSSWVSTPAENWCAKLDPATGNGVLFLGGEQAFSSFYAKKGKVTGFLFDGGYLAPGKSFSADYVIRPIQGLSGITTANRNFAAYLSSDDKKTIRLQVLPYASGTLSGTIQLVNNDGKQIFSKPVTLNLEKGKIVNFDLPQPKPENHTVIRFQGTMNGLVFATEQYCENGFRMQSLPACGFAPYLPRAIQKKEQAESDAVAGDAVRQKKAIRFFGLFTNFNRFEKILNGWAIDDYSVASPSMSRIPPASTIDEYAVMILSNAFVNSLEVSMKRIQSFVRNGGVLIVTGGPSAFGTGGYDKNATLRNMLPVECAPFDLRPAAGKIDQGTAIRGTNANVYWLHDGGKLKPGAEVLLQTANGKPLLVKGRYGKGIVLCWLGSPLGNPPAGSTPYWDSDEYVKVMQSAMEAALAEVRK